MWELDQKEGWVPKNRCFWTVVLHKILESPLDNRENKPVNPKWRQPLILIGRTDAEAEPPMIWSDGKSQLIGKDPDAGKDWRQEEKKVAEDETVGQHHWFSAHELGWTLGDGERQGGLACCSLWGQWGENKLAKMAFWGSLAPHFVNNDYVTAEITYSTACAQHKVLTSSWAALCNTPVWIQLRHESPGCCCTGTTLEQQHGYAIWGYVMAPLWLGYGYVVAAAMAAVPARREEMCLQFLQLFLSSSSLFAHTLPTLGSKNSMHSVNSPTNRMRSSTGSQRVGYDFTTEQELRQLQRRCKVVGQVCA